MVNYNSLHVSLTNVPLKYLNILFITNSTPVINDSFEA